MADAVVKAGGRQEISRGRLRRRQGGTFTAVVDPLLLFSLVTDVDHALPLTVPATASA